MDTPSRAALQRRELELRRLMIGEFGIRFPVEEAWLAEGRVLSVEYEGRLVFPAFQFGTDGKPLPVVAEVLEIMPTEQLSAWEMALWWTAANEWLDGRRPVDLLASSPDSLPRAAAHLSDKTAL